jgi:hypothetical protein
MHSGVPGWEDLHPRLKPGSVAPSSPEWRSVSLAEQKRLCHSALDDGEFWYSASLFIARLACGRCEHRASGVRSPLSAPLPPLLPPSVPSSSHSLSPSFPHSFLSSCLCSSNTSVRHPSWPARLAGNLIQWCLDQIPTSGLVGGELIPSRTRQAELCVSRPPSLL